MQASVQMRSKLGGALLELGDQAEMCSDFDRTDLKQWHTMLVLFQQDTGLNSTRMKLRQLKFE